jgi:hypothetical protein
VHLFYIVISLNLFFYHCPREANVATHSVASYGVGLMSTMWHEEPPDFLYPILADDVTIIPK